MNQELRRSLFFVITGPSGVGKDSVIEGLKKKMPELVSVITTSTRPMREGETNGNPYYFISRDEFEAKRDANEFLEWANVYGNYYGSEINEVERMRQLNGPAVFKIDIQGARALKKSMPEIYVIFIAPQDHTTLTRWIHGRGKDAPEAMERRLATAKHELADISEWDAVVINKEGTLEKTVQNVFDIIRTQLKSV